MIQILKLGALYFAGVFGAGFVLGTVRVLWVVPRLGARAAELIEAPIMLLVVVLVARAMVGRHAELTRRGRWLAVGFIALAFLLSVEFTVVLWLRGLSVPEYFATRDPVSSAVYFISLGLFAVMPFLLSSHGRHMK